MWVSVRVCGFAGVWVCWCLGVFFFAVRTRLPLPAELGCLPSVPAGLGCFPACLRCLPAFDACLPSVVPTYLPWVPAFLPWVPACLPCLPASLGRLPALGACLPWVAALGGCLGCLHAFLDQTEFVVIFLFSSVRVVCVSPRGIRETCTSHTLTVCSFLRIGCWNKIIPCIRSFVGFLPQSRRWLRHHVKQAIGPEVPDECPFSAPSPRETVVQKFPMHACS